MRSWHSADHSRFRLVHTESGQGHANARKAKRRFNDLAAFPDVPRQVPKSNAERGAESYADRTSPCRFARLGRELRAS